MKKVCLLLANGFEEVEALTQVDYLKRAGIHVDMISVHSTKEVTGAHDIKVESDRYLNAVFEDQYDGIIIPGGKGVEILKITKEVISLVQAFHGKGKLVAAICAGPVVLGKAGLLQHKKYTCFPCFSEEAGNEENHKDVPVVIDEKVITEMGVAFAQHFAFAITEYLEGEKTKNALIKETLFNRY